MYLSGWQAPAKRLGELLKTRMEPTNAHFVSGTEWLIRPPVIQFRLIAAEFTGDLCEMNKFDDMMAYLKVAARDP